MSINTDPTQKSSQRAFSLQKYLLLHSQQAALQTQIETIFSTYSNSQFPSSTPDLPSEDSFSLLRKRLSSTPPSNPYTHTHLRNRRSSTSHGTSTSRPSSSLSNLSSSSSSLSSTTSNDSEKLEQRRSSLSSSRTTSPFPAPPSAPPTFTSFPDPATAQKLSLEQSRLKDVNLQIKTTLTELLNSEGVRTDPRFRGWVQSRLMDVERELRDGRTFSVGIESM